jgi:hypothetical protein
MLIYEPNTTESLLGGRLVYEPFGASFIISIVRKGFR